MEFGSSGRCSGRHFSKPDGRQVRVMVVDDYQDSAEIVSHYLSVMGFDACYFSEPDIALGQAGHYVPDIVLLDINMPRMDGFEVARAMREDAATSGAVLIALTSDEWASIEARALAADFDGYFRKATPPGELVAFLTTYIADPIN